MAIVHTIPDISVQASGPSYSVRRLCESLTETGADVTLATVEREHMASPPFFLKSFPLGLKLPRLAASPAMKNWLLEQARCNRIDLLHTHGLWGMPNVYPGQVAKKYDIPLVVAPRGTLTDYAFKSGSVAKRFFWPLLQKPALEPVSCFHATAESEYANIRRMGFEQPVMIIPNGVDIPLPGAGPAGQDRTLLYLGRLHAEKGVDVLLNAWQVVSPRFKDWRLRIVGPDIGGYLSELTSLASSLELERIEFSGAVYGEEKQKAYDEAELYVLPSPSENFGMTVAEALAAGTPAIATKGAPWSGLDEHEAGWWVDLGLDPMVALLEEALECSRPNLAQMGERGRNWVEQDYGWPEIARKTVGAYRWIIDGGSKPDWIKDN